MTELCIGNYWISFSYKEKIKLINESSRGIFPGAEIQGSPSVTMSALLDPIFPNNIYISKHFLGQTLLIRIMNYFN